MKKNMARTLALCVALTGALIVNCGGDRRAESDAVSMLESMGINADPAKTDGVSTPVKSPTAKNINGNTAARAPKRPAAAREKADIDLTPLNKTMLFAMMQNIMSKPEDYLGKTIRISGVYDVFCYSSDTEECHHFVTIDDAAACCKSGIEFRLNPGRGEYPGGMTLVEVTGVFRSYEKFDRTLYYLAADGVTILGRLD